MLIHHFRLTCAYKKGHIAASLALAAMFEDGDGIEVRQHFTLFHFLQHPPSLTSFLIFTSFPSALQPTLHLAILER